MGVAAPAIGRKGLHWALLVGCMDLESIRGLGVVSQDVRAKRSGIMSINLVGRRITDMKSNEQHVMAQWADLESFITFNLKCLILRR